MFSLGPMTPPWGGNWVPLFENVEREDLLKEKFGGPNSLRDPPQKGLTPRSFPPLWWKGFWGVKHREKISPGLNLKEPFQENKKGPPEGGPKPGGERGGKTGLPRGK